MNFSNHNRFDTGEGDINITPLVDVLFALIMFFMLSTTFAKASGMDITLPQASTSKDSAVDNSIIISVNQKDEVFVADKKISLEELPQALAQWQKRHNNTPPTVIIWGDQTSQHGMIVSIMDVARTNGFEKLAIATTPKK